MQDPTEAFSIVEKIVQLCKQETGAVYLLAILLVVVVNFLPLRDWAGKIFNRGGSTSQHSDKQLNQYVFPHSESPTIIQNLNLMLPPEENREEGQNGE